MCETDGYIKLILKGLTVIVIGLFAVYRPDMLTLLFTYPILAPLKVYHILWLLAVLVLIKRMIPRFNAKMSSGKVFEKNFSSAAGEESDRKRERFRNIKKKTDSGAMRSGLYWILLLLVMWMWRLAGILPNVWLYVIVLFFIFMDQFCISVFCPFQWLMGNKCCNTCRINNWGYCMAFSPLIFIPAFWTYSIVFLSLINIFQWEYLYFKHPERFYETYNAGLMCKNCGTHCRKKSTKFD
jgi:hypothetical protein